MVLVPLFNNVGQGHRPVEYVLCYAAWPGRTCFPESDPCRYWLFVLRIKPVKHVFADDAAALLLDMGLFERFNAEFPKVVRYSGNQRALVNELRHPIEQFMLFFHVVCLKHGAGKHKLPAKAQSFGFD